MSKSGIIAALFVSFLTHANGPVQSAEIASVDDTARYLAGMQPSAGSPLTPLTESRSWQQYANSMNQAFAGVDKRQLSQIRDWSSMKLKAPKPTVFYMFSGPDFLYANAFFPHATTYVLSGLEPTGPIPDLLQVPHRSISPALTNLQNSMRMLLAASYFITKNMSHDLQSSALPGTVPLLYVFLARSGKNIHDVSLVSLDNQGELRTEKTHRIKSAARGVKIVFAGSDGRVQTLYYFSTDLSNSGIKNSGFLTFCAKLGTGDGFAKSASYIMHNADFSRVREFLLNNTAAMLQDDTGIPLRYFDIVKWDLQPFGRYLPPISIPEFAGMYQTKMRDLFKKEHPETIGFGVGYHTHPGQAHLLLAVKRQASENK